MLLCFILLAMSFVTELIEMIIIFPSGYKIANKVLFIVNGSMATNIFNIILLTACDLAKIEILKNNTRFIAILYCLFGMVQLAMQAIIFEYFVQLVCFNN